MDMDDLAPLQHSDPPSPGDTERKARSNLLPQNVSEQTVHSLTFKPRVTSDANDRTVQRRQKLPKFFLVSRGFTRTVRRELYKNIHVSTETRLRSFLNTVRSHPRTAKLVKRLSLDLKLCGGNVSGPKNRSLCLDMYRALACTTNLKLLSLNLKECNCCFRNSDTEGMAIDGPKVGYDNFFEAVARKMREESTLPAKHRTFLPQLRRFHFTSTKMPYKHCAFFALPSLKHVESARNTGTWSMILDQSFGIGLLNPHIRRLVLKSSALIPAEARIITNAFPNSEVLTTVASPREANINHNEITPFDEDSDTLS
ncbi:hypothetical protein DHEL01_v211126 [Diaporthe helianthi]|uniref:Uncharacterized protein n=1 Tax=Diaporthe helianthi TaxID=158607 RepID=A0A2P5HJP1_DIAHE|nr:hypothetical protein DHEL01_v211126 [Diaporthe helianthi]